MKSKSFLKISRYFIPKFLIREKIANTDEYDSKIIRVADSFVKIYFIKDFVCDVKAEKIEDFTLRAEDIELSIQILDKLPKLFQFQKIMTKMLLN